jgi:hypothetical protein
MTTVEAWMLLRLAASDPSKVAQLGGDACADGYSVACAAEQADAATARIYAALEHAAHWPGEYVREEIRRSVETLNEARTVAVREGATLLTEAIDKIAISAGAALDELGTRAGDGWRAFFGASPATLAILGVAGLLLVGAFVAPAFVGAGTTKAMISRLVVPR